jgi:hypothetical protein
MPNTLIPLLRAIAHQRLEDSLLEEEEPPPDEPIPPAPPHPDTPTPIAGAMKG